MTEKNLPITSGPEQARIAASAKNTILPPAHIQMEETDLPFFNNVIAEFAKADWSQHQLELAALLARSMADLEREQRLMRKEGTVVTTDKGVVKTNPRQAIVQNASATVMQIRKTLSLHARAQEGESRDIAKRREMARQLEMNVNSIDDAEDLIAFPASH